MRVSGGPALRRHPSSDGLLLVPPLPSPRRPDRRPPAACRDLPQLRPLQSTWRRPTIGALIIFAALAVLLFGSAWAHPSIAWIGDGRDPHLFIWYLGWTPRQLSALHNPFFTTDIDYPGGANLMWNTAIFVPATLLWPVTAAFGTIVSYNVMATVAVAL